MSDELYLEKLKINERLGALEITMSKVLQTVEDLRSSKNDVHDHIQAEMKELRNILYGMNGKTGLIVMLDRLTQDFRDRRWTMAALWAAVISAIVPQVIGWFIHHS